MKTKLPISTICYLNGDLLLERLEMLVSEGVIDFYAFIFHYAEADELKPHIHLYVEPCNQVDTKRFEEHFKTLDNKCGCIPFRVSKRFGDWYYYCCHDKRYLFAHGNDVKKYTYGKNDFVVSDENFFVEKLHQIDRRLAFGSTEVLTALREGSSAVDLLDMGVITLQQYSQYSRLIGDLMSGKATSRRVVDFLGENPYNDEDKKGK